MTPGGDVRGEPVHFHPGAGEHHRGLKPFADVYGQRELTTGMRSCLVNGAAEARKELASAPKLSRGEHPVAAVDQRPQGRFDAAKSQNLGLGGPGSGEAAEAAPRTAGVPKTVEERDIEVGGSHIARHDTGLASVMPVHERSWPEFRAAMFRSVSQGRA